MKISRHTVCGATMMVSLLLVCTLSACAPYNAWLTDPVERHATRNIALWGDAWRNTPLPTRVALAPEALVEKIILENRLYGFPERPSSVAPEHVFFEALKRIDMLLPDKVRMLAIQRIIGIFLVKDLGGTGYAEAILDGEGKERYAVIVLDRDVLLKRQANAWATWKENSVFKTAPGNEVTLQLVLEKTEEDSVVNAIEFILLHEMGHALGMASGVHPSWNGDLVVSAAYLFTELSWRMRGNNAVSRFDEQFPQRSSLRPYAFQDAKLALDQAPDVYRNLQAYTNFPSVQAAVTLWEDFAESFATYLHVVLQDKPYKIHIRTPGQPEQVFPSCWREKRCEGKKAFMRRWFDDPFSPAQPARQAP